MCTWGELHGEREDMSLQLLNTICEPFEVVWTHHTQPNGNAKLKGSFPHGGEIIDHRKIKNLPTKSWSNHSCPHSGVCLLSQILFKKKFQSSNSRLSTGIKLLPAFFTFSCIEIENRDENASICLENSILISKHFFMSTTSAMTFWFWIRRYKELMRPN